MRPHPSGVEVASLRPGDEITLAPGYGYPRSKGSRTLTIADVDDFSAITADGVRLSCDDGEGIQRTGRTNKVNPNEEVRRILEGIGI